MKRKEIHRPDLQQDYHHLCSANVAFTDQLYGDDISKEVKEIQDVNRVGKKIAKTDKAHGSGSSFGHGYGYGYRGRGFARGGRGRGGRGRGRGGRGGRGRGRISTDTTNQQSKNLTVSQQN